MDTDEAGLRRSILENPADDTVRLAYADHLDETDEREGCGRCPQPKRYPRINAVVLLPCLICEGVGTVPGRRARRAAHIRWAVRNPHNSAVCLCGVRPENEIPCEVCRLLGEEVLDIPKRTDGETHYVANRGFVSEIRCTLAGAFGAFLKNPVTRVVPCDRTPLTFMDAPAVWERDMAGVFNDPETYMGADRRAVVPGHLFDRMTGETGSYYFMVRKYGDRRYPSIKAAYDDLSRAIVDQAREDLRLLPLTTD